MDVEKKSEAFRNISEVATELDVPKHVLRFWEGKFTQLRPMKRGGGRRYYRPEDVELLKGIRHLLYSDGFTIRGVQKLLREKGIDFVKQCAQEGMKGAQSRAEISSLSQTDQEKTKDKVVSLQPKPGEDVVHSEKEAIILSALGELEACRKILYNSKETS
ncbi:MAG: MerR family transcriptional regulator [Pseudomonadota bacterium]